MVEATGLKISLHGHLERHHLPTKFHENPPIGSNVICGGHRQAGDFVSPLSFFEYKLKINILRYTPCGRQGGEEVWHLLVLDLGTRWG
jgi:hypothetical protein